MTANVRIFGMPAERGRWVFVALGFVMNICMGSIYAYSIFKPFIEREFDVSPLASAIPFMLFSAFFAFLMFFGGKFMEIMGPRYLSIVGGVIMAIGWMLASYASNAFMLAVSYGVIGGAGVGLAYGCPIAIAAHWFPDRTELAANIMLAGFGGSAVITGTAAMLLIDRAGVTGVFMNFGITFLVVLFAVSLPLRFPAPGWRPAGWAPADIAGNDVDFDSHEMIRTASFWGLSLCVIIGCTAGLMAICIAVPAGMELAGLDFGVAAALVGLFSAFNALGRILFGALSDRTAPRRGAMINFAIVLGACALMVAPIGADTARYIIAFCALWLTLGGWLAIAPAATASFFGIRHYAKNYGVIFFAYGIGAVLGGAIGGASRLLFGSYRFAFHPVLALAALGIVLAALLITPPRTRRIDGPR